MQERYPWTYKGIIDRPVRDSGQWIPEKDKIAEQYQIPVRHIHDVLRNEIPVFVSAEEEKKFNEISQQKFLRVSKHQNLTNVFSQFKVKK